jgi:molybdopterin-guanine dinucleotide biosynthesis protein A
MLGAVLVGGASRRMGVDKALIDWRGQPLARHVAERLREVCRHVVLVGGAGRDYGRLGLPWWPDLPGLAGRGPMAGLLAALREAPAVVLAACDLPHLDPGVVRRLIAAAGGAPVAIPCVDEKVEPLLGLYRWGAARAARGSLALGSGKMADLLQVRGARLIPGECLGAPEEVRLSFRNINSPIDLAPEPRP